LAFADQLVLALEDKGFDALLDRHDIDAAEKWKDRLGALLSGQAKFGVVAKSEFFNKIGWRPAFGKRGRPSQIGARARGERHSPGWHERCSGVVQRGG